VRAPNVLLLHQLYQPILAPSAVTLKMDTAAFAKQLKRYANSGASDAFDLFYSSCLKMEKQKLVVEYAVPADDFRMCVTKLLDGMQSQSLDHREWQCLCFLASATTLKTAARVITEFSVQDEFGQLLAYCTSVLTNGEDQELMYCYLFLYKFSLLSNDLHGLLYNAAELREAIFHHWKERFAQASCETQTIALRVAINFVCPVSFGYGDHWAATLVHDGAICAVKCAALHVLSLGISQNKDDILRMAKAILAFSMALGVVTNAAPEVRAQVSDELYKLTRNDMFRLNVFAHRVLTSPFIDPRLDEVPSLLTSCCVYIREIWGAPEMQSYLLYKPPRDVNAKPIAALLAEYAIKCDAVGYENTITTTLRTYVDLVPEVDGILQSLPPPPERVDKDRRCAHPDCYVTGEGKYNKMKKCNRCKAVYYCRRQHQEEHWPEHRLTCVKATTAMGCD
jgi:hypothetical protein